MHASYEQWDPCGRHYSASPCPLRKSADMHSHECRRRQEAIVDDGARHNEPRPIPEAKRKHLSAAYISGARKMAARGSV